MPKHVHYNESVCSLIVCENCSTERNPTIKRPNRERDSLCSSCRLGKAGMPKHLHYNESLCRFTACDHSLEIAKPNDQATE